MVQNMREAHVLHHLSPEIERRRREHAGGMRIKHTHRCCVEMAEEKSSLKPKKETL